ncbi:MAG: phosphate acyltransferase PlsX [Deltaproteobacteria bacterium]
MPSSKTLRVALDAMGGDFAPAAVVAGAASAVRDLGMPLRVILVGDEAQVRAELSKQGELPAGTLEVRHASEVVLMGEHPGQALRHKKDSSLRVCFDLIKRGEADAMVSAGNSGAVMAGAILVLGRLDGVERPAIAALIPSLGGRTLLLDAGANTDCKPVHLVQFALMGEVYVRRMLGVERPKLAILANGEEASKGTELTRAAAEALSGVGPHFVGYAEGKDIFSGEIDVVSTDGFTGNVALKSIEGCAQAVVELLRRSVGASLVATAGMALARPALRRFKATIDWDEHGGAPLIGVDGVGIIAHGRSGPKAIRNAIRVAAEAAALGMGPELAQAAKRGRELCGREAGNGKEAQRVGERKAGAEGRAAADEAQGDDGDASAETRRH